MSSPQGPALASFSIPVAKDQDDQVTHVAIVDFSLEPIQKLYSQQTERLQFLTDSNGEILAHVNEEKILSHANVSQQNLVKAALSDKNPRRQIHFSDEINSEKMIGAYVKLDHLGLITFSQISNTVILEPAQHVKRKAYYIAGMVVSVAIFLIFLFSMTLTGPIEKLVALVSKIAQGQFDQNATKEVKTWLRDEVHDLAFAIDHMTLGLKERDKVKNLFSKFHGSSVAEDLIKNDISIGGSKKEVTVFFSDIRGFTSFSEKRTPEEVVQMLNEYFEVMVAVITRSGGVVDKFIGDAIMAVWGAPHSSEKDTANAVQACLDMRIGLDQLNEKRIARGHEPLLIGMGLHTGLAISGTIGSTERMEYTVIGDTINMSSRIEASTKAFGTDLLVSQAVLDKTGDSFVTMLAGKATVKGKAEPLNLYRVLGYKDVGGAPVIIETPYSSYATEKDDKVKTAS
jgi:adenylate cyclase